MAITLFNFFIITWDTLIAILSILLNLSCIKYIFKFNRLNRAKTHINLRSLVCSDVILFSFFCLSTLQALHGYVTDILSLLTSRSCTTSTYVLFFVSNCSWMHIFALSVHRCLIIKYPMLAIELNLKRKYAISVCALSWFYGVLIALPPLFGYASYGRWKTHVCTLNWSDASSESSLFIVTYLLLSFCLPMFGIIYSFFAIPTVIRKSIVQANRVHCEGQNYVQNINKFSNVMNIFCETQFRANKVQDVYGNVYTTPPHDLTRASNKSNVEIDDDDNADINRLTLNVKSAGRVDVSLSGVSTFNRSESALRRSVLSHSASLRPTNQTNFDAKPRSPTSISRIDTSLSPPTYRHLMRSAPSLRPEKTPKRSTTSYFLTLPTAKVETLQTQSQTKCFQEPPKRKLKKKTSSETCRKKGMQVSSEETFTLPHCRQIFNQFCSNELDRQENALPAWTMNMNNILKNRRNKVFGGSSKTSGRKTFIYYKRACLIMLTSFLLVWVPFALTILLLLFGVDVSYEWYKMTWGLSKMTTVLNTFVYAACYQRCPWNCSRLVNWYSRIPKRLK